MQFSKLRPVVALNCVWPCTPAGQEVQNNLSCFVENLSVHLHFFTFLNWRFCSRKKKWEAFCKWHINWCIKVCYCAQTAPILYFSSLLFKSKLTRPSKDQRPFSLIYESFNFYASAEKRKLCSNSKSGHDVLNPILNFDEIASASCQLLLIWSILCFMLVINVAEILEVSYLELQSSLSVGFYRL